MLAHCDHCEHWNDVPAEAEGTAVQCGKCGHVFTALSSAEAAANRRAGKILLAAILIFLAIIALLLFLPRTSGGLQSARQTLLGSGLANRLPGAGDGGGTNGTRGSYIAETLAHDGPEDPQATNNETSPDRSIGRLAKNLGVRKAGEEVRAGAAGTDAPDSENRIGNSPRGQMTNAPSAGANPGNSDSRNSVETPEGDEALTGRGAGGEASGPLTSTNSRATALLLDDFSERLRQAGARSGDVQISLEWKNINDLDLHVIDPSGAEIFYNNRRSPSGGLLDVDMNAAQFTARPVENVFWPERGAPRGRYRVDVVHFANHGARDPTQFTVRVVNKGQTSYYRGYVSYIRSANRTRISVCAFTVQ